MSPKGKVQTAETPRDKAHRLLDDWLDGKLTDLNPDLPNSPAMVNLGYTFAKALTEAKEN